MSVWRVKEFTGGKLTTVEVGGSSEEAYHRIDTNNGVVIISYGQNGSPMKTPIEPGKNFFNQLIRAATEFWARDGRIGPAKTPLQSIGLGGGWLCIGLALSWLSFDVYMVQWAMALYSGCDGRTVYRAS